MLSRVESAPRPCPTDLYHLVVRAAPTDWRSYAAMSMMINPSGGGQIIATGQPFTLRLRKKKANSDDAAENGTDVDATADAPVDEADEQDSDR